jgi:hypothetical protein
MIEIIRFQTIRYFALLFNRKSEFMGFMRQVAEYLYLKKPDPNREKTQWMKYMHGINRISIFMFLFALIVMLTRLVIIPLLKK